MKSYSVSSDSSSDDEALIALKNKSTEKTNTQDPNEYTSLLKLDWQQCEFCDEVFANRYSLVRHNISHIIIPLIKQSTHQCYECYHHFTSIEDLNSHISKLHTQEPSSKRNEEKILQSIIKNEAVFQCQDDLKDVLVNHSEYKSKISKENCIKTEKNFEENSIKDFVTNNVWTSNVKHALNSEIIISDVRGNAWTENSDDINVIKEEPSSPRILERLSSPMDEDKESIRQRLLFEEDVADTLIKDLSLDYQVNIETLCNEVTLDFDDAIFEDDDSIVPDSNDGTDKFENRSNNTGNVAANELRKTINNFENRTNGFGPITNKTIGINNLENGTNKIGNLNQSFNNGMDGLKNGTDNNLSKIEVEDLESYGESIHFDTLMVPDDSVCKFCKKKFPNRFLLIQHEKQHLTLKRSKQYRSLLCCFCERYIFGNYHTLRSHKEREHPNKNLHKQLILQNCPKCKLKYFNYAVHLKYHHTHYFCADCNRGFETLAEKNEHDCNPNLNGSNVNLNSSNVNLNGPKPNLNGSNVNLNGPKPNLNGSNVNLNGSKTNLNSPKLNLNSPKPNLTFAKIQFDDNRSSIMQLCELCYSFMKSYIESRRHNYVEVGVKSEYGVRQNCDKCNNLFFSVKLVKRRCLVRMEESKKTWEVKPKVKPLSNKERLLKIQNRLKLMKKINR